MTGRGVHGRVLGLMLAVSIVGACSTTTAPSDVPSGTNAATPGSSAGNSGSSSPSEAPAGIVTGPGDVIAVDFAAATASLGSYRARLVKSFTGAVDGEPQTWSVTVELAHVANPLASSLTVETTGQAEEAPGQVIEIGGLVYALAKGRDCVAGTMAQPGVVRTQAALEASLFGVVGAESSGSEAVGTVTTDHATFDERAIGLAGIAHSSGELWIASSGGYLMKYTLTTDAGPDYFGEGISGTATWLYELSDVNAPMAIDVPQSCPAGLVDAPTLADATDVVSQAGLLTYTTAAKLQDVISFYQGKATGLDWKSLGAPLTTKTEGVLEYSSPEGSVTVLAIVEGTRTKVIIVQDRAAP